MRLALGFGSLVGLMLLTLSLVSWQLHHITDLTERFATQDMQRLLRVQVLALTTEGAGTALLRLMNAPAPTVCRCTPMSTNATAALTAS